MDDRIRQLGSEYKNKTSKRSDINLNITLDNNNSIIKKNFNPMTTVVSSEEQFNLERQESNLFGFSGKFSVITGSELNSGPYVDVLNRPTSDTDWDPLFTEWVTNGTPNKSPTNWVFQLCYPSDMDSNYKLWGSNRPVSLGMKVVSLNPSLDFNNRELLTITTKQNHGLNVDDYVHLNDISNNNRYVGIHRVSKIGTNGENTKNSFTLDTTWVGDVDSSDDIYIKRVVDVSSDDVSFSNNQSVSEFKDVDVSGGTTNGDYLLVKTSSDNSVLTNGYVEFRNVNGGELNGLHLVIGVVDSKNFIIKPENKPQSTEGYRVIYLNSTPCDYYIRKFELLTGVDYDTYPTAYSSSIYPDTLVTELGVANKIWSYNYNKDVNTTYLTNNRGGIVTELKMCILKKSGELPYNWSNVTSHWEFDKVSADTINRLEDVSLNNSPSATIVKNIPKTLTNEGSKYFGDIVEFNRKELNEKVITEVVFRFGLEQGVIYIDGVEFSGEVKNLEGYYYKPFKTIDIYKRSNIISTFNVDEQYENIPSDAVFNPNNTVSWREVLKPGVIQKTINNINGVNWPFINGRHYVFVDNVVYVRRQNPNNNIIDQSGLISVDPNTDC